MSDWVRLVTADDPIEAGFLHGLVESAGIEVQLRSMELWGVAVEIYYSEGARPSLWVHKKDLERARQVLAQRHEVDAGAPWVCPDCGERLAGQFTSCWRCGSERGGAE